MERVTIQGQEEPTIEETENNHEIHAFGKKPERAHSSVHGTINIITEEKNSPSVSCCTWIEVEKMAKKKTEKTPSIFHFSTCTLSYIRNCTKYTVFLYLS